MPVFTYKFPRPALTVDIVIYSIRESKLHILLIQRGKEPYIRKWALPGGFLEFDESLMSAAARELEEETGLKNVHLKQLFTFGDPGRDPRGWVVTVSFYSIIKESVNIQSSGGSDANQAKWFQIDKLPPLAFDHDEIITYGLKEIRNDLRNTIVGFNLLSDKFLITKLQQIYETILDDTLDNRNFQQNVLEAGIIEPAPRKNGEPKIQEILYQFINRG